MNTIFRFINFVLFTIMVGIFFYFFPHHKITQEVLDLFPSTKDREIIDIYREFANSRYVLVAVKGFDEKAQNTLESFLLKVQELPNVQTALTYTKAPQELQDFITENYLVIATPKLLKKPMNATEITDKMIEDLQKMQSQISKISDDFAEDSMDLDFNNLAFNPYDSLGLFAMPHMSQKNLIAKDYGYMGLVELKSIEQTVIKETIEGFAQIAQDYPQIRYFSQNFMEVTNLELILSEVNFLLSFASIVFIILYFVIIRIPFLTLNTICTLIVANIIAMFVVAAVYPKVTIMALSFGMGISNIAIDYMMHHNFFSLYARKARVFNRPVFYGYITTIVGFVACLFIPFPLLAQLSLYAIVSLTYCYISFAFIYPSMGFAVPRFFPKLMKLRISKIPSTWFLIFACIFFIVAGLSLKLDFDLSKLDYQNKPLLKERDFFHNVYNPNQTQILLSHSNIDGLIELAKALQKRLDSKHLDSDNETNLSNNNHIIHPNMESALQPYNANPSIIPLSIMPSIAQIQTNEQFLESPIMQQNKAELQKVLPTLKQRLLQEVGNSSDAEEKRDFLDTLFDILDQSYTLGEIPHLSVEKINQLGLNVVENPTDNRIYYLAMIDKDDLPLIQSFVSEISKEKGILADSHIEMRPLQSIIDTITDGIYTPMLIVLGIALCCMLLTLIFTTKGAFVDSVVFVVFPLSCALCVVASHSALNIMHLFALLILVIVSVDYGIYLVKDGNNLRTAHAIFFSAITTGASFGILIISHTKALNSFGEVIFTGMGCILILLFLHRPMKT